MQNNLFYISIIFAFMISSCNAQERVDIASMSYDSPVIQVKEKPQEIDGNYMGYLPRLNYEYKNMEAFCFNDFKFANGGESLSNRVTFYLNQKQDHIISTQISLHRNEDSEAFFNYLEEKYGLPIVLQPEPAKERYVNDKPFGFAYYLWKNVASNRSIILSKNYVIDHLREDKWRYDLDIHYVKTEDPDRFTSAGLEVNAFEYLLLMHSEKARGAADRQDGYGPDLERFKAYVKSLR